MKRSEALRILRQNKRNYNTIAHDWNVSRGRPSELKIKMLESIKPGFKVLDLGCGNGFMAAEVIKRGAKYTGLDFSSKLLKYAKSKYAEEVKQGRMNFVEGDALKVPFQKNSFDFIFSFAVLHHIPSENLRLKFLKEVYRLLKSGGEAVLINWNLTNDWPKNRFDVEKKLKNITPGFDPGDVLVPWRATGGREVKRYIHVFEKEELHNLCKRAGFKKIRIEYRNRKGEIAKGGEEQVLRLKKSPA